MTRRHAQEGLGVVTVTPGSGRETDGSVLRAKSGANPLRRRPRTRLGEALAAAEATLRARVAPRVCLQRSRHGRCMWIVGSDPAQFSFEFALWTRDMVRQVIRREFKISLSVVSVGRLLRTMGLSPQRPLYRAYQQNPEAVQRWRDEQFPAIRKQAKAEGPRSTSPTRPAFDRTTTPAPPGPRSAAHPW